MSWIDPSPAAVTVAQLVHREVILEWPETVAVVLEIADALDRSPQAWLPSYQDIALTSEGSVEFLREPANSTNPLTTLADILRALLPTDAPQEVWDVAAAAGPDSPTYDSVGRLAEALREFDPPRRREVLARVHQRAVDQRALEELPGWGPFTSEAPEAAEGTSEVQTLSVDKIRQRRAGRSEVSPALVDLVRKAGVLQPLLVRAGRDDYEVLGGAQWLLAAKAAGLTRVPCRVCHVEDDDARMLMDLDLAEPTRSRPQGVQATDPMLAVGPTLIEVADSLNAAVSCWSLGAEESDRPYHEAVRELTQIELRRAAWLVEALRVLSASPPVNRAQRNLGIVLERAFQATHAERRQGHVRLLANLSHASVMVAVDERLVVLAFTGIVSAMLSLVRRGAQAVVKCEVSVGRAGAEVAFFQEVVAVSPTLVNRFFDETFADRPGGHGAAVGLAVASRIAELHGGLARVESLEPVGCRVTWHLPAART